jgi:hypothetical protein
VLTRHFPPPWTIEEHNNACFIVKDATGQGDRPALSPIASKGNEHDASNIPAHRDDSGASIRAVAIGLLAKPTAADLFLT